MKKHTHRWSLRSYSGKEMTHACKCGEFKTRSTTKEEASQIKQSALRMFKRSAASHRVWHNFTRRYMEDTSFKLSGYAFMKSVASWAKRFPDDVHILRCDDSMYMGSNIVLIEHKTPGSWHGVSAVTIPQCGDPVVQVFLYPGHVEGMIRTLQAIQKKSKVLMKEEKAFARAIRKQHPFG